MDINKEILTEATKRVLQDSQVPAKYYLSVIELLKKKMAEYAMLVAQNKKIVESNKQLVAYIEKQASQYARQISEYENEVERLTTITHLKGEPGKTPVAGIDYPIPENGKDAVVDETKIVNEVLSKIKVENGKDAIVNEDEIIKKLVEYIKEKKQIDISHIRNWQSLKQSKSKDFNMNDQRWHGGGGLASISSAILTLTGTFDDSNVTFTVSEEPSLIVTNSGLYTQTGGAVTWTYSAGTITLSQPVGTNGYAFALK